jgi:hyperosmotically inducible protein
MRFGVYACGAALVTLVLAGCDRAPRTDTASSTSDTAIDRRQPDPLITGRIQAKYFASPDVKAHRIDVDTKHGIVTLEGTVDTEAQREVAAALARGVEGVTRVENNLLVRAAAHTAADTPRHHSPDASLPARQGHTPAWVTAKIQSQYYLNPELKPWRIDVDTSSSGAVTLSGTVDSGRGDDRRDKRYRGGEERRARDPGRCPQCGANGGRGRRRQLDHHEGSVQVLRRR